MSTELAEAKTNAVATADAARFTAEQIQAANLSAVAEVPALEGLKKHFMPSNIEYWTPVTEGEEKLVYVAGINVHEVPDMETGEIKQLECVQLLEKQGDTLVRLISASKVLVGNIRDAINRGEIQPMTTLTPVAIKFLGQKKNRSNAKLSNRWLITPLVVAEQ